jgi:hypothetical protein
MRLWNHGTSMSSGYFRHVDDCLVRVVVTEGDQVMHALPAHVAQGHWRAGWVLRFHRARNAMTMQSRTSRSISIEYSGALVL